MPASHLQVWCPSLIKSVQPNECPNFANVNDLQKVPRFQQMIATLPALSLRIAQISFQLVLSIPLGGDDALARLKCLTLKAG
jgi:hypothetical protein